MPDPIKTDYYGFDKAHIDTLKCINCGLCEKSCRFGAISNGTIGIYECEGCGVCANICPVSAIEMKRYSSGNLMLYKQSDSIFSTACLKMGSGASGKLVSEVKKQLLENAPPLKLAVIDGSPGIGCPVIASVNGADIALIVAEPTLSGIHDMKRISETLMHFEVRFSVCINKFNINLDNTKAIEEYCAALKIPVIGKIPFDETVIKAVNCCKSIASYPESPAGQAIKAIWVKLIKDYVLD